MTPWSVHVLESTSQRIAFELVKVNILHAVRNIAIWFRSNNSIRPCCNSQPELTRADPKSSQLRCSSLQSVGGLGGEGRETLILINAHHHHATLRTDHSWIFVIAQEHDLRQYCACLRVQGDAWIIDAMSCPGVTRLSSHAVKC